MVAVVKQTFFVVAVVLACRAHRGRRPTRDNAGGALRRGGRRPARPSRRRDEQPLGRGFAPRVDRDAKRDRDGPRRSDRQPRVLADRGLYADYPVSNYGTG